MLPNIILLPVRISVYLFSSWVTRPYFFYLLHLPPYVWVQSRATCFSVQASCCLCLILCLSGRTFLDSWAWIMRFLNISKLSWASVVSRAVFQGILPSRSLKSLKSPFLKDRVVVLLFALLPPLRILNSTISLFLQSKLPLTFISDFDRQGCLYRKDQWAGTDQVDVVKPF